MALSSEEISLSCSQNCQDNQIELIIKAFNYLTKEYPADKNERRIIRREAAKLTVDKGDIFLTKRGGRKVGFLS